MPNIPEIPKYIKYDFLITIIGLLLLSSFWYYSIIIKIEDSSLGFLFIAGLIFTAIGLLEMFYNYKEEREIIRLENIFKNKKLINLMSKERLIEVEEKEKLISRLKEKIKDIVDKSQNS
jgi:uncharacterized membrane protein YbhN (UPF0104 family)